MGVVVNMKCERMRASTVYVRSLGFGIYSCGIAVVYYLLLRYAICASVTL